MNESKVPEMPKMPISRLVAEYADKFCECCGSSLMMKKWVLFGSRPGCIQPECKNYGGRNA